MKKLLPTLLAILAFLIGCSTDPYITVDTNSKLAIEHIKSIDTSSLIENALLVASGTKVDGITVSNTTITDDSISMTIELGEAGTTTRTARRAVNTVFTSPLKGILNLKLLGEEISIGNETRFKVGSYSISSDNPIAISNDKNGTETLKLNGEFGGDAFATITIGAENTIEAISETVIAVPLLPIGDSSLLLNGVETNLESLDANEEVSNIKNSAETEINTLETEIMTSFAKELLSLFDEEQFRYGIATLNKEVGPYDKATGSNQALLEKTKKEVEELNKNPHIGIADYLSSMKSGGNLPSIALGGKGLGWVYPKQENDIVSSSGLKLNGLYLEIKEDENKTRTGNAIMDITFAEDTSLYFKDENTKIKAGSRLFLALQNCSFDYKGAGNTGDNMMLTASTYNISTSPNAFLSSFLDKNGFEIPPQGSLIVEYLGKSHNITINDISGDADIYIGMDYQIRGIRAIKTTLELNNSLGAPTSGSGTIDGIEVTL